MREFISKIVTHNRGIIAGLLLISAFSSVAVALGHPLQFFIWEFRIDFRVIACAALVVLYARRGDWKSDIKGLGISEWKPIHNFALFFLPLALGVVIVLAGHLFGLVSYEGVDNPFTFALATFVDIPATYFFGVSAVLIEEAVFRSFVFGRFSQSCSPIVAAILTSLIWTLASADVLFEEGGTSSNSALTILLGIFAVGMFCSSIYKATNSVWPGYSYRIGILAFLPAIVGNSDSASDSFFASDPLIFCNRGLLFSVLNLFLALMIFARNRHKWAQPQINRF